MVRDAVSDLLPRRPALLIPVVAAHFAVLAAFLTYRGATPVRPNPVALTVIDIAADTTPGAPSAVEPQPIAAIQPPISLPPISLTALPLPITPPSIAQTTPVALSITSSAGGGCDLTDVVQSALRQSPVARTALASLPRTSRSVANAVMLWDGGWIGGTTTSTHFALDQLRRVVIETVSAASPECRAENQIGPRLLSVPGTPDAVLAIGSGAWRWADLAPEDARTRPAITIASSTTEPAFTRRDP